MKKMLLVFAVSVMLVCSAVGVCAADYSADEKGLYEIVYESEDLVNDAQYGFIVINGMDAVLDLNEENISEVVLYIDQAAAKDNTLDFGKIGLKDTEGTFKGATAFIGGGGKPVTAIGNLLARKPEFEIKGTIKDNVAGTKKLATITVMDGATKVATVNSAVGTENVEEFSVLLEAGKTYSVLFTKAGYLDMEYKGVTVDNADVNMGVIDVGSLAGDVDGSNAIVYDDLSAVISNYGKKTSEATNENADIDCSGAVIYDDLSFIIGKYGKANKDFVKTYAN